MKHARAIIPLLLWTAQAHCHDLTFDECLEGSEFILHAAMSRDDGMTRADFVGRVHADLLAIRQFPPELRWFAQDEDDERFLVDASEAVFDAPREPERHQSEFLQSCVGRIRTDAGADAAPEANVRQADVPAAEASGL